MALPTEPAVTVTLSRLRAHWMLRQGLAAPVPGDAASVVAATGWPRTLGGVDAYLAVLARAPHLHASDLDRAICQEKSLVVVPAARSCIYVVPRDKAVLALRYQAGEWRRKTLAQLAKVGVTAHEFEQVEIAAAHVLQQFPHGASTDALRAAMPKDLVRSLGEAGKKLGVTTAFPSALRALEMEGKAQRLPEAGHLRSQGYLWLAPQVNPVEAEGLPQDPVVLAAALATVYLRMAGPATLREFADWAALTQRDAKAALGLLNLAAVAVEGEAELHFVDEDDLTTLRQPQPACVSPRLLSFIDSLLDVRASVARLIDPRFHQVPLPSAQGQLVTAGSQKALWQRAIVDEGSLVGVWEFDPDRDEVALGLFEPLRPDRQALLEAEAHRVTLLLRKWGDARAFSLDTPATIRQRVAWVRQVASR